jgi:hypothetical protein
MSKVVLITGCFTGLGRYLAAVPISGRLVIHLHDFVWGSVLKQMLKVNPLEMPS